MDIIHSSTSHSNSSNNIDSCDTSSQQQQQSQQQSHLLFYQNIDTILSNHEKWNNNPTVSSFRQLLSYISNYQQLKQQNSENLTTITHEIKTFVNSLMLEKFQGMMRKYNNSLNFLSQDQSTSTSASTSDNLFMDESFGGIWLVKPTALSCGRDIAVVKGIRELLIQVNQMNFNCVVQKYIERPFLVRNQRKFDIRQWILVTNLSPMIIYGFSECYLRLSGRSFTLDNSDKYIHLCNHSIQKDDFQQKEAGNNVNNCDDDSDINNNINKIIK